MMDFFTLCGLLFTLYVLVYLVGLFVFDCDMKLAIAERFGNKIESLRGKVVWVTGASSGIGESLAVVLARSGVKLILSARREDQLERVKQKCLEVGSSLSSKDILVLPMDVMDCEAHEKHFKKVIEYFGDLDILVNNAGRTQRSLWEDIELAVDKEMFDLNVFSVVSLSRTVLKYFLSKGEGHFVVTSSVAGVMGVPFSGTYTATKHAIHGYFNSLRAEKMATNIKVTLLCPGPTFTNFLSESFTGKAGEKFGKAASPTDRRMTAERCAYLSAIAIANGLPEAWMALFPIVMLAQIFAYYPNLSVVVGKLLGPKFFLKMRDSKETMKTE